jgi:hypothetical protein
MPMAILPQNIPREKMFVEVNTQEKLIISNIGVFACKKDE